MGMGEPAHNLDNVLEAIDLLGTEGNIGHKNLVFSTVGDLRVFEALPQQRVKPALALSLHTTKAELRTHLLPRAPKIAPEELIELGEKYARDTDYPIQYQWTLLKGINDGDDELDAVVRLLKGKYGVLNVIPFNSLEGDDYQRPETERIHEIVRSLQSRGVLTKVRNSAGQDVDGGCGQLRARAVGAEQVLNCGANALQSWTLHRAGLSASNPGQPLREFRARPAADFNAAGKTGVKLQLGYEIVV